MGIQARIAAAAALPEISHNGELLLLDAVILGAALAGPMLPGESDDDYGMRKMERMRAHRKATRQDTRFAMWRWWMDREEGYSPAVSAQMDLERFSPA